MNGQDLRLLNDFQRDFPLTSRPFARLAEHLEMEEAEVIDRLSQMQENGEISRVGPVFTPNRVGVSILAAMAMPETEVEQIGEYVSSHPEVNHNYQREHEYNLWFVVTAPDDAHLQRTLDKLETKCGYTILRLPLEHDYHIDLGFHMGPAI